MGHTITKVKLRNPRDLSKCLELELLVDTGSTYTWVKRSKLKALGVEPMDKRRFRTIENRIIDREVGEAIVEFLEKRATCMIVFAEEEDNEVLGITALENLGLEVDPVTKQLKEVEAILAL